MSVLKNTCLILAFVIGASIILAGRSTADDVTTLPDPLFPALTGDKSTAQSCQLYQANCTGYTADVCYAVDGNSKNTCSNQTQQNSGVTLAQSKPVGRCYTPDPPAQPEQPICATEVRCAWLKLWITRTVQTSNGVEEVACTNFSCYRSINIFQGSFCDPNAPVGVVGGDQ
jgi:hypothetical protein